MSGPARHAVAFWIAGMVALFAIMILNGCGGLMPTIEESDDLQTRLAMCRKEARVAADAGATPESAYMRYQDCKRREHIEGVDAR